MGLLDGDIASIVDAAVSPLLLSAAFHSIALTDDGAGGYTEVEAVSTCKAFTDTYSDFKVLSGAAQPGDYKIVVVQNTLTPTPKVADKITIESRKYKITEIAEDPASATWEFRCRDD